MELNEQDRQLLAAIQDGLPLASRPYATLGERIGMGEARVMVVWDVPDAGVGDAGRTLAALPFVTLCYRRPRRPPVWPYNLFCMIHGRDRGTVEALVDQASAAAGLEDLPRAVLFSRRAFKQRGARYAASEAA